MAILLPSRLETHRLILRAPRRSDAQLIFDAYTQDPDVTRYMVWRPHVQLGETEGFIASCMQSWASGRSRPYVLACRDSEDVPIGMLEARIVNHTIDLGYVLQRASWGTGLMPEAVEALSNAALAVPECFRVQATCDSENRASARVLERSGFVREGQLARHAVLPNLDSEPRTSLLYARWR